MDTLTRFALRAGAGDGEALAAFVEATYEQVWRFSAALVGAEAADDASQETFAQAVRCLSRFRGDSSAQTWLLAIARNVCADELRGRARRGDRDARLGRRRQTMGRDPNAGADLTDLISRLDLDRRSAFVLTQVLGLTYQEAAGVCGCPIGSIRSRVARARAELVAALGAVAPAPRAQAQ